MTFEECVELARRVDGRSSCVHLACIQRVTKNRFALICQVSWDRFGRLAENAEQLEAIFETAKKHEPVPVIAAPSNVVTETLDRPAPVTQAMLF